MAVNTDEIVFADGFKFRKKHPNQKDFVLGSLSIKVDDAVAFLKSNSKNGWVNVGIKESKAGNPYMFVDNFEPKQTAQATQTQSNESDVPF
ncbi:MAG: hypothetical protein GOVbin3205_28 [Prokaryotic dsDNA virus sp.]|nr:MAG: hypothetical protein GOVbin3205_28 [Prokaryotic dsDNA virus sp.]|tara:strand:+ start:4608 stop:4880 length:273 start_codon:yes stop_codon:yes gene_type:complete